MSNLIKPRTLKGFRDFLPETMMPREALMETARKVYRSFGYAPIDTPALELFEILGGKGSDETDRQMYRFTDNGKRDVGMRFDLTVPLARFVAQHSNELGMPFKRYHIAKVWRGESPQAGRFREFMQCDFDTIGSRSVVADIETGLVIHDLLRAIGFEDFKIQVNNRRVLNGLLDKLELADHSVAVLRALDKLAKIGPDKVVSEIQANTSATHEQTEQVLKLAAISGDTDTVFRELEILLSGSDLGLQGVDELKQLTKGIKAAGADFEKFKIDVSIARGLDYYTGTIYETFLGALPGIGSVCSGGRYDNLLQMYTKQSLPGIGASLGLDRLLAAMEQLELIPPVSTPAQLMIVNFDPQHVGDYLRIANQIRTAGIGVEVFPDKKKLGQQFKYADRRGFQAVLTAGENEFAGNVVQLKWLESGEQHEIALDDSCQQIVQHLLERVQ